MLAFNWKPRIVIRLDFSSLDLKSEHHIRKCFTLLIALNSFFFLLPLSLDSIYNELKRQYMLLLNSNIMFYKLPGNDTAFWPGNVPFTNWKTIYSQNLIKKKTHLTTLKSYLFQFERRLCFEFIKNSIYPFNLDSLSNGPKFPTKIILSTFMGFLILRTACA